MDIKYNYEIRIPMSTFMAKWHKDDPETYALGWLTRYVDDGFWDAGVPPDDADEVVFLFVKEEDAMAFKLKWI